MILIKLHYTCQALFEDAKVKTPISRTGYFSTKNTFGYLMNKWNTTRDWKYYETPEDVAMNTIPDVVYYSADYFRGSRSIWGCLGEHKEQEVYIDGETTQPPCMPYQRTD